MKVAVLGAGPAGLYFAISMKRRNPAHEITVFERNKPDDTFGWGVVLSAETLDNLAANDAVSAAWIREYFAYWDDIAVIHKGVRTVSTGHGFCGIGRKRLLLLLQRRARDLGIELSFETEIDDPEPFMESHDLVIGADGLNSRARSAFAEVFKPDIDVRKCKFVWLGTRQKFDDAFTFIFEETEHGWVWAHAYQFESETATFIVECSEETWAKWGFGDMTREQSIAACERIFAKHLGGHSLISNAGHLRGSAWINFPRVLCERWSHKNLALLGDASASAHFSIGSGTKLALESAVALADYLHSEPGLTAAFDKYESARRTEVLRLQSAARNSLEWFEEVERYLDLDPVQFNYSLLTRSQRISHENLRVRDPEWLGGAEAWFQRRAGNTDNVRRAPMFAPFQLRDLKLENRVVVSPMAQYKAVDGCPTDWHFAHYAERAKGGAGLVHIEMTCVSPEGRITPGCTGFYAPEHEVAWKRLVDFVHAETEAKICAQIGHSGAKGSTQLGWQQIDAPLPAGNWPLISASDVGWSPANQVPKAMDRADMARIKGQFVAVDGDGGALRLRHARNPRRARLSAVVLHHADHQPSHRRLWRLAGEPAALSAGDLPRRPRGLAGGQADLRAHLGQRLDGRRGRDAGGGRRDRAAAAGRRRRHLRRVGGPNLDPRPPGLWSHVPDAVLRPHPQRDRHGHHGGGQHLRARPRQLDPAGRPRRPGLPGAAASRRSLLDPACRRAARRPRREVARSLSQRA